MAVDFVTVCYATALLLLACGQVNGKDGFYGFKVKNIRGEDEFLNVYKGKVSLVVNLASECGYTDDHYKGLSALYNDLAVKEKEPFTILGFPCNQFGEQEPHDDNEIEDFARQGYGVAFPLFSKLDVTDRSAHPAFRFLAEKSGKTPTWNFWKYLVDADGNVVNAWGPRVQVEDIAPDILEEIKKAKLNHSEL